MKIRIFKTKEITFIIILFIILIINVFAFRMYIKQSKVKEEQKIETIYSAWCKETGNPKHLTKDEFKALKIKKDLFGDIIISK